jgi:small subunit ribosomal protein S20
VRDHAEREVCCQARTNDRRRLQNRDARSRLRTAIKKVRQAGSAEDARTAFRDAESLLDRLTGKGIIHKNAAARHKTRLSAHVSKLETR